MMRLILMALACCMVLGWAPPAIAAAKERTDAIKQCKGVADDA